MNLLSWNSSRSRRACLLVHVVPQAIDRQHWTSA